MEGPGSKRQGGEHEGQERKQGQLRIPCEYRKRPTCETAGPLLVPNISNGLVSPPAEPPAMPMPIPMLVIGPLPMPMPMVLPPFIAPMPPKEGEGAADTGGLAEAVELGIPVLIPLSTMPKPRERESWAAGMAVLWLDIPKPPLIPAEGIPVLPLPKPEDDGAGLRN